MSAGVSVLELGSGVGAVGLLCCALGAQVTLSDLAPALPLLARNCRRNGYGQHLARVAELDWLWAGEAPSKLQPFTALEARPDVIVASDVWYGGGTDDFFDVDAPVVLALAALMAPHTVAYVAHQDRPYRRASSLADYCEECGLDVVFRSTERPLGSSRRSAPGRISLLELRRKAADTA